MAPQKAPQALRWLENNTLQSQSFKMVFKKAPQALRRLENSTLQSQGPKMDLQKMPQALAGVEKLYPEASSGLVIFLNQDPLGHSDFPI